MKETSKSDNKKGSAKPRKKKTRTVTSGIAHVNATFNNTIVTITDPSGHVISWCSAGKADFSGSRKSTAFAATRAAEKAAEEAKEVGLREIDVMLKGPGAGREASVRGLQSAGLTINTIFDKTPVPHNGCRPRKRRRV
jgi:small subunit ribosomal protein S11